MSKDTFYFKHDNNASQDLRIVKLKIRHGMEGYGIFWHILELLHREGGIVDFDPDIIGYSFGCDREKVRSVIEDFGLFIVETGKFYSPRMCRDIAYRTEKIERASSGGRKSASTRNQNPASSGNAEPASSGKKIPLQVGKERKGKEKEEKKEEETPLPPLRTDAVSLEQKPELPPTNPEPPEPPGGSLNPYVIEFKAVYPNKDGMHHAEMAFARAVTQDGADPETLVKKAKQYAWLIEKTDPTQKMFKPKNWLERKEYLNDYAQLWKDWKEKKDADEAKEKPFYKPVINQ